MIRYLTAGESHGPAEVAIIEGVPAGLPLSASDIQRELEKRRSGAGRGGRGSIEKDQVRILSGVRFGKTLGSPIALLVENNDFVNWERNMSQTDIPDAEKVSYRVTAPRPGHTDLPGVLKYHFDDVRNVLERASARETVMRVAVGAIAKQLLEQVGIRVASHTIQIGSVRLKETSIAFDTIAKAYENDPETRCIDPETARNMKALILTATKEKNTLGGVIEIVAQGVMPGLGSYVHWDRKLDGRLAQKLMSIPSVKAVEIGRGVDYASQFGSTVHDEIFFENGRFLRHTNRAGGIEGGVSNGENVVVRVYHKPISTLNKPLSTVDIHTKETVAAVVERSDICVVPRAGSVSEAAVAWVLVDALLEKFGSDTLADIQEALEGYMHRISTL